MQIRTPMHRFLIFCIIRKVANVPKLRITTLKSFWAIAPPLVVGVTVMVAIQSRWQPRVCVWRLMEKALEYPFQVIVWVNRVFGELFLILIFIWPRSLKMGRTFVCRLKARVLQKLWPILVFARMASQTAFKTLKVNGSNLLQPILIDA